MYEIDGIVYAGEPDEIIGVTQVWVIDDSKLLIWFSTGERKVFDAARLIGEGGVFSQLADKELFRQAHVGYGTVVWNETLDIAPEYLYENSAAVDQVHPA
jgi:hypothetical protein